MRADTKREIIDRMNVMYPVRKPGVQNPYRQFRMQEPYRSEPFDLFLRANERETVAGDALVSVFNDEWHPDKLDLSEDANDRISRSCDAWGQWLSAKRKLSH